MWKRRAKTGNARVETGPLADHERAFYERAGILSVPAAEPNEDGGYVTNVFRVVEVGPDWIEVEDPKGLLHEPK